MSTYRPNRKGFDDEVLCAGFMVAEMAARAERIKAVAEATAPDATPFGEGFKYSFVVESGVRKRKTRRAFGRVTNTDPDARYIEFGTRDTPAHRTLGKAADAGR